MGVSPSGTTHLGTKALATHLLWRYWQDHGTHLQKRISVHRFSDGSAKAKQMAFKWIISTTKGHQLANGQGSCADRPISLCGKASRMLSSSLFITILKNHYHCIFQEEQLSFMADNLELITRLKDHRRYINPYPNTTLEAEFDLTEQIHLLHENNQLPSYFKHVKGHQDQTTEYAKLDLSSTAELRRRPTCWELLFLQEYAFFMTTLIFCPHARQSWPSTPLMLQANTKIADWSLHRTQIYGTQPTLISLGPEDSILHSLEVTEGCIEENPPSDSLYKGL